MQRSRIGNDLYKFVDVSSALRKSSPLKSGQKRPLPREWGSLQSPKVFVTEDVFYNLTLSAQKNQYPKTVTEMNSNLNDNQGSFTAFTSTYYTNSRVTNEKGLYILTGK